jgi:pyruvate dehydrogenase (quinone)
MGCAIPYALAAKLAFPDRIAFAFLGDGAMQMNGLAELVTVANTWQSWSDPRFVIHVLNNRDLGFVTWEQRAMEGAPRFPVSQAVPDFPYARYAEMLGMQGIRVGAPDQVDAAWDAALRADRPVLIEAITDPDVPTLPPEPEAGVLAKVAAAIEDEPNGRHVRRLLAGEGTSLDQEPDE